MKHLNCKLYYQQLHLKYLCNLARYWLQAVWGWHDSVETCSSVIICGIVVRLLVIVQNLKSFKTMRRITIYFLISITIHLFISLRYRWTVRGSKLGRSTRFFPLRNVRTSFGAHPASYTMAQGFFLGGKVARAWSSPLISVQCQGQERVELYPFSPLFLHGVDTDSFTFSGAFAKLRNATISFVVSVHRHGATQLPLDGFSLNLIYIYTYIYLYFENLRKFKFY